MEIIQSKYEVNTPISVSRLKILYHINYLVSYPLSDSMLEGWDRSISELMPDVTDEDIKQVIDKMKLGLIPFDGKKGIQNLFIALRSMPRKTQRNQSEW